MNFGIGGDRTQQVLWRMENGELDGYYPKLIVIAIGINNTWDPAPGSTPKEVAKGLEAILKTARKKQPNSKILIIGVLPSGERPDDGLRKRIREINSTYEKLADGKTVRFFDFGEKLLEPDGTLSKETAPDFLHLSTKGYEIYTESLVPVLEEMLK